MGDLSPYIGQTASMGSKTRGSHTAASIFLSISFRSLIGFPLLVLRLFTKCYGCSRNCIVVLPYFSKGYESWAKEGDFVIYYSAYVIK